MSSLQPFGTYLPPTVWISLHSTQVTICSLIMIHQFRLKLHSFNAWHPMPEARTYRLHIFYINFFLNLFHLWAGLKLYWIQDLLHPLSLLNSPQVENQWKQIAMYSLSASWCVFLSSIWLQGYNPDDIKSHDKYYLYKQSLHWSAVFDWTNNLGHGDDRIGYFFLVASPWYVTVCDWNLLPEHYGLIRHYTMPPQYPSHIRTFLRHVDNLTFLTKNYQVRTWYLIFDCWPDNDLNSVFVP